MSEKPSEPNFKALHVFLGALLVISALSLIFTIIFSWRGAGLGILISLAGLAVGGFVGVLFAVPRVIQDASSKAALKSSSSLEEAIDWLLKVVVGASLSQVNAIAGKMSVFADLVAAGLIGENGAMVAGARAVALALITLHPVIGFLLGFFWVRLRLSSTFDGVEKSLRGAAELAKQVEADARAGLTARRDDEDLSPVLAEGTQTALKKLASVAPEELQSSTEKMSWAWAKADQVAAAASERGFAPNALKQARVVLENALLEDPAMNSTPLADMASRRLDEAELFGLLYQPGGAAKAVTTFSGREAQLTPQGLGYLVCAYGQLHEQAKDPAEKARLAGKAWTLMEQAIKQDSSLESWFRYLLTQDASSVDNDLASIKNDEPFKSWLAKKP